MPPLPNPRHEKFAQGVASGKPKVKAYEEAGYSKHNNNATRLMTKNDEIPARIFEIQAMDFGNVAINRENVAKMFLNNYSKADASGNLSAANVAAEKLAKLFGLMVERREVGAAGEFAQLSDAQLIEILAEPIDAFGDGDADSEADDTASDGE